MQFETWRRNKELCVLPYCPAIQRGQRSYSLLKDDRLRRVTSGRHRNRICLVLFKLDHIAKGLRKVRFVDQMTMIKEATLDEMEMREFRS